MEDMITYERIKSDETIKTYIQAADDALQKGCR